MSSSHDHRRDLVGRVFEDLGRGDGSSLRAASAADVSWWLPLGDAEHRGLDDVESVLLTTLGHRDAVLQSVIVGEDGGSAVVEQLLTTADGSTPATSVLTLRDEVVVAGRTYLDVAAWQGHELEAQDA